MKIRLAPLAIALAPLAIALAIAACSQPTATIPPVTASPSPSAPASAPPSASVAPSESPSASPSAAPISPLGVGERLKPYSFNDIGGLFRDPARDQLYVIDAQNKTDTPRRYLARKFQADGTFISTVALTPEGGKVPDAVDGVAFDQRGIPFFNYRENKTLQLMKLVTAAVVPVTAQDHPLYRIERAGATTLAPMGSEMLVAAIDHTREQAVPNEDLATRVGTLVIARAEEGESPSLLNTLPDPLHSTVRMAFGPDGNLFLAGPNREGQLALVRVKVDRTVTTLATGFPKVPDSMVVSPSGDVLLAFDVAAAPAKLQIRSADGALKQEVEFSTTGGGFLTTVQGLTFDAEGRLLAAGKGFDGSRNSVIGVYRFGRPTL